MNTSIKKLINIFPLKGKKINVAPPKDDSIMNELNTLFILRDILMTSLGVKLDAAHYYIYETKLNNIEVKIKIASREKDNSYLKETLFPNAKTEPTTKPLLNSYLSFYQIDFLWLNESKKLVAYSLMGKDLDLYTNSNGVTGKKITNIDEKKAIIGRINLNAFKEHLKMEIEIKTAVAYKTIKQLAIEDKKSVISTLNFGIPFKTK